MQQGVPSHAGKHDQKAFLSSGARWTSRPVSRKAFTESVLVLSVGQ